MYNLTASKKNVKSFLLHWEQHESVSNFATHEQAPYSFEERGRIADRMSVEEILGVNVRREDATMRRERKWKEITHLFNVIRQEEYSKKSIENALWLYGTTGVTVNHFAFAVLNEFRFDDSLHMDAHLRWLYWSFDGGRENMVDWRQVMACCKLQILYKMIRIRPAELMIHIFDIFASNANNDTNAVNNGSNHQANTNLYLTKKDLMDNVICLHCIKEGEFKSLAHTYEQAAAKDPHMIKLSIREGESPEIVSRGMFRSLLRISSQLVDAWKEIAWLRIPAEQRMDSFDESQRIAMKNADVIVSKFLTNKALHFAIRQSNKRCFKQWKDTCLTDAAIRKFAMRKIFKLRGVMFKFWFKISQKQSLKRRRKLLTEVMGSYTIKARIFARIKLFNYTNRRLMATVAKFDKPVKFLRQAQAHLRIYFRLRDLRSYLVHWKGATRCHRNEEVLKEYFFRMTCSKVIREWGVIAHSAAHEKRMETLVMDNQRHFMQIMKAAEEDGKHLIEVFENKKAVEKKEKEDIQAKEREEARARNKKRIEDAKRDDKKMIESMQRDARRRRVKAQLKKLKKKFELHWKKQKNIYLQNAEKITKNFIESKDSDLQMHMRFQKLKREFYMPPCPENEKREVILTNPANIVFLYLDAKLDMEGISLLEAFAKFDTDGSGALSYDEFRVMIKALKVKLTPQQIESVINGVDQDGDGFLDLKELEDALKNIDEMGVPGSQWKLYVDPAQDVICYHNFYTNEKILEYEMTDKKLHEINIANYYGEAAHTAKLKQKAAKDEDWERRYCNYMARRMQYMYKIWKCRKKRRDKLGQIQSSQSRFKHSREKLIMTFLELRIAGWKARVKFEREYKMTIEKVFDTKSQRMFWYNHVTKASVWEQPKLIRRYGDVEKPFPWVVNEEDTCIVIPDSEGGDGETTYKNINYWHVIAKKQMTRKPDGVYLCSYCQYHISIRKCLDCDANFCFTCFRELHSSPFGFNQRVDLVKETNERKKNTAFIEQMTRQDHRWKRVEPKKCVMCNTDRVMAAYSCEQCEKSALCRPCARRLHNHPDSKGHTLLEITG